ncbi:MAG TPA: DNA repair protein RadC [Vicinamibacterales bacterium]
MKDVHPDDRPREKLARLGTAGLGDNELLAIVLGTGTAEAGALALANAVLDVAGGLQGLLKTNAEELLVIKGLGQARAAQMLAAVEIGRRVLTRRPADRPQITSPRDAAEHLMPEYSARPVEQFGVVLLDARHRVLRTNLLAVGSLDATTAQPREVFRQALLASAAAVVLFHNHPSGDPHPSPDDVQVTRRMVAVGQLMGIQVIDHVVLGDGRYCSLKEAGFL